MQQVLWTFLQIMKHFFYFVIQLSILFIPCTQIVLLHFTPLS
uniref:Uncharacterized protein n=1 Tax=Rhizophora mucronata TaxID=61149 RepID=A0A2P2NRQ2_RHIMU